MVSLPYLTLPSPSTTKTKPTVATIFQTTRCCDSRRLIRSIPRPIRGPAITTATKSDAIQLMWLA